jgi:hypothetical protein
MKRREFITLLGGGGSVATRGKGTTEPTSASIGPFHLPLRWLRT